MGIATSKSIDFLLELSLENNGVLIENKANATALFNISLTVSSI